MEWAVARNEAWASADSAFLNSFLVFAIAYYPVSRFQAPSKWAQHFPGLLCPKESQAFSTIRSLSGPVKESGLFQAVQPQSHSTVAHTKAWCMTTQRSNLAHCCFCSLTSEPSYIHLKKNQTNPKQNKTPSLCCLTQVSTDILLRLKTLSETFMEKIT